MPQINFRRFIDKAPSPEIGLGMANEIERVRLRLRPGDHVYRIRQLRIADDLPLMVEEASLPTALFPGLEIRSDFAQGITHLARKYSIPLNDAEERISGGKASPDVAAALCIAIGSPVTVLDRVVESIDGRPVEWRIAWCDRYCLNLVGLM